MRQRRGEEVNRELDLLDNDDSDRNMLNNSDSDPDYRLCYSDSDDTELYDDSHSDDRYTYPSAYCR